MAASSPRRQFLTSLALVAAGTGLSALAMRGVRLPFMPEPRHVSHQATHRSGTFAVAADGAFFVRDDEASLLWRAFEPEPRLQVTGRFDLHLDNIHPDAVLTPSPGVVNLEERIDGLNRRVTGEIKDIPQGVLHWHVPFADEFTFAAIGDTGGDRELAWTLERAQALGAKFLLLIGDIYYQPGDDQTALKHLSSSPLPVYAAIGNHDVVRTWDRQLLHWFEESVGPRNSIFRLGGIQFVNLDTATDTIPWSAGQRGVLLSQMPHLSENPGIRDYVVFSHRPITDLRPPEQQPTDHSIENFGEGEWLRSELLNRGVRNILNGHIHASIERDDQGLHTFIAGEGMAHLDIVRSRGEAAWFDGPEQRQARILMADVRPQEPVRYRWENLLMPLAAHCNTRLRDDMAREQGHFDALLNHLERLCGPTA